MGGDGKNGNDLEAPLIDTASNAFIDLSKAEAAPKPTERVLCMKLPAGASTLGFKGTLKLVTRMSFMCVLCSTPVLIPEWNAAISANPKWKPYLAYVGGGVVLMVIFTVFANLGSTLQLFYQGGIGTFWACFWVYFMSAIMPDGAAGDYYYAPLAHLSLILFIFGNMWLNLSKNVRIFILSYQVYFAMEFMDPSTKKGTYNTSWWPNPDSESTVTLLTAVAGLVMSIPVLLFPSPILAKHQAKDAARSGVEQMCGLMDELVEYFKRDSASVLIAQKQMHAMDLRKFIDSMPAAIEASWWETFDIGAGGRRREYLHRHVHMLRQLNDNAFAMQICLAKEDFADSHVKCMKSIDGEVEQVMSTTRKLLTDATASAADGDIDPQEAEGLTQAIADCKEAMKALAVSFNKTRRTMFPNKVINTDLQSESFFVYCLSSYARQAQEYAYLMLNKPPATRSLWREVKEAFVGIFDKDVLMARLDIHAFTIRGTLTILICYYAGMYWVGFNAVAAGTSALLISDFAGSALQKNLGRIQAVVIGAIVPHILAMIIGSSCEPHITVIKMVAMFLFLFLTLYIYLGSPTYGYIGCLCAAFSTGTLVYPCGAAATAAEEQTYDIATFTKMTQTTVGVIIMTVVDLFLCAERASDGAGKNLLKGMLYIDAWFQGAFLPRDELGHVSSKRDFKCRADIASDHTSAKKIVNEFGGPRQPGTIMGIMNLAQFFGAEANMEPRYHRSPWPTAFFDFQCLHALKLRANLAVVEAVLKGTRRPGNKSYQAFKAIRDTPAWEEVRSDVVDTFGTCIVMVQAVVENETGEPMTELADKLQELEGSDSLESMPKLFKEINACGIKYPTDGAMLSLEDDEICRLNVILMMFDSNIETIAAMMKECLKMIS